MKGHMYIVKAFKLLGQKYTYVHMNAKQADIKYIYISYIGLS